MTDVTLWHNPRCSKSRQALKLLEEAGHAVTVRRYLEDAPGAAEIEEVLAAAGLTPIEMMRVNEPPFREAGLSRDSAGQDLVAAMAAHPILIERPVAIAAGRAVLGRPPERVLEIV